MRRVLLTFVLLAACGGSSKSADEPGSAETAGAPADTAPESAAVADTSQPEAAPAEAAPASSVDLAVAMFESMVKVVVDAGDCDTMAADLNAWVDANQAEYKRINDELNASGKVQEVQAKVMERPELMQSLQNAVTPCKDNQAVMEAFMRAQGQGS